jgi:hypothetical protein
MQHKKLVCRPRRRGMINSFSTLLYFLPGVAYSVTQRKGENILEKELDINRLIICNVDDI